MARKKRSDERTVTVRVNGVRTKLTVPDLTPRLVPCGIVRAEPAPTTAVEYVVVRGEPKPTTAVEYVVVRGEPKPTTAVEYVVVRGEPKPS